MTYDPALLLRKSWANADELAQELYVLMTAAQQQAPQPSILPTRSRLVTRPPGSILGPAVIPSTPAQVQVLAASLAQPDIARLRQAIETSRSTVRHDPELPRPPVEPPPGKPLLTTQAPEGPPKVRESLARAQSPPTRRSSPASGAAPFAGPEPPEFLTASIATSAFDPGPPVVRDLPATAEVLTAPGLRSVPPAAPEPVAYTAQFSPTLRADSQLPVGRPTAALAALPIGTPVPVEVDHPLAEFPLEQLRTEIARRSLATQADSVKPAPILDPPFAFVIMGLVQIDDDGVTALKTPATGGEGQGTPGKGKAYLLDHNGNNLELNSNDKLDVWNLGDAIAPNTYTEAFLIQEEFWWVIGRTAGGAFFADHLNIAAATGLLTGPPTLHSTTGNVYRINNGAMELYKSSGTIYNGMPDATDSTMRQIMNENIDGTFTVTNESCTAP